MSSINEKLERIRKPRVHIKYEVQTQGAESEKELPFVVGVVGDFSGGHPGEPLKPLKNRKFINIDRSNFDTVMGNIKPGIKFRVENTLANDESSMNVQLQFKAMQDFLPAHIIEQVPSLKKLKQIRDKLRDLLTKTDRSDELEWLLEQVLQDPKSLELLATELGINNEKGGDND
jgi:type VI secretion system protein ImpB